MNNISLRINKFWKHLYYQGLYFWDHRYPLPFSHFLKQDHYLYRIFKGFYPFNKIEIHKTRGLIEIYIIVSNYNGINNFFVGGNSHNHYLNSNSLHTFPNNVKISKNSLEGVNRNLFNILKTRIQIYTIYTFPLHDAELLINNLIYNEKIGNTELYPKNSPFNKSKLRLLKRLWKMGVIKGIKIKIKGRYKKSTRTKNEVYQFGQIPNTPTTNLQIRLFYKSHIFIQSLGTSSFHLYICY